MDEAVKTPTMEPLEGVVGRATVIKCVPPSGEDSFNAMLVSAGVMALFTNPKTTIGWPNKRVRGREGR